MSKLDRLFNDIKNECLVLIHDKRVDIEELSFQMGVDMQTLYNLIESRNDDFSLYLKLYEILLTW